MRTCVAFRQDFRLDGPVECYARSVAEALEEKGHEVYLVGEGHTIGHSPESLESLNQDDFDCLIEIENGRNSKGEMFFQQGKYKWKIPSCVWLIDSHGQSDIHQIVSKDYNHVFFAVWNKRDLYASHPSAHWAPCATDFKWFDGDNYPYSPDYEFGFFGSKTGLVRADPLVALCEEKGWTYDVRQVTKARKHKWPMCAGAMSKCHALFNHGQKHDGPNQRVMESMAMRRPLITDLDPESGMSKLFEDGKHFIGYESLTYKGLESAMWVAQNCPDAFNLADEAYLEVKRNHQVSNRVDQMLEVIE